MSRQLVILVAILPFVLVLGLFILPRKTFAAAECASIGYPNPKTDSSCAFIRTRSYIIDACNITDELYRCGVTDCVISSSSCSSRQSICNNGYGGTPNDGYTCEQYCNALATPANCGDYPASDPRPDCFTYKFNCGRYDCTSAGGTFPGGAPNYTCPSNQVCTSNHICVTQSPAVTLTVNNVFALTVNKGDQYVLDWNIGGSASTCTNNWGLSTAPASGPGSGMTTDSKQDAGTYVYSLTCSNSAGSDTKGVSVLVKQTCPDYTSCSTCISKDTCGWKGDNNTCQTGTSACPANTTSWFWTDCLTNMCVSPPPPTTSSTTCTGSPTCTVSAGVVNDSTVRGTVELVGCTNGYELNTAAGSGRVNWLLNNSCPTSGGCTNSSTSADFTSLSCSTTQYTVTATLWSTAGKPQVICTGNGNTVCGGAGTPPPSTTTSTPTGPLVCLRGDNNCGSGDGYWYAYWPVTTTQCNYPKGTTANVTDQYRVNGKCWVPTSAGSTAGSNTVGVHGKFLVRNANGSETAAPVSGTDKIYPIWFWIYHNNLFGSHCILSGAFGCIQENIVDGNRDYAANGDAPLGEVGTSSSLFIDHLQLWSWPDGYRPIGYYTYQDAIARTHTNYTCSTLVTKSNCCTASPRPTECENTLEDRYGCTDCGGTNNCISGNCSSETITDGYTCKLLSDAANNPNKYSVKSGFQGLGSFTKSTFNEITSYCAPNSLDNARVDIVFEKLPILSGLVCKDNNSSDGSCTTGTGAARTCTDGPYTSGTVTATKKDTGPTFSRQVTPGGGYSMYLSSADYYVSFSAPNVTVISPTLPKLIPNLNADTTQDFCVNPTSAWLKTTGGDVHSNTSINTPGGP